MSRRLFDFNTFIDNKRVNEDKALVKPSIIQSALQQAADVKSSGDSKVSDTGTQSSKAADFSKVSVLDLFFATKVGQSIEGAIAENPDVMSAWKKGGIIPSDSPSTVEDIEKSISTNPKNKEIVDKNIENMEAVEGAKSVLKPDYSLLPPSQEYEFKNKDLITWKKLKEVLDEEGDSAKMDFNKYNMVALRNYISVKQKSPNHFVDLFILMSPSKDKKVWAFPATTVPGPVYMPKQFRNWYIATGTSDTINPKGIAIVQPGVYEYVVGGHSGYKAFNQKGNVKLHRYKPVDDPKKANFDTFSPGNEENGKFGINIHRADSTGKTETVGSYSAGCMVFQNAKDLNFVLDKLDEAKQKGLTVALLEMDDVGKELA
jgi:hypothetical protein